MHMKTIIKGIAVLTILSALVVGQLRSTLPSRAMPVNTQGLSHARNISILDPNRFSMNHSFGLSMMSAGNQSMTMGAYTNQMNYMLKDNLRLSTRFSLASPMSGMSPYAKNGMGGSQLFYGASLDYQPTENLFVKFSMDNYPRYGFSKRSSRIFDYR